MFCSRKSPSINFWGLENGSFPGFTRRVSGPKSLCLCCFFSSGLKVPILAWNFQSRSKFSISVFQFTEALEGLDLSGQAIRTWVHHAIAFAIASEFCRKHPFARNFRSENENLPFHSQNHSHSLVNSFATPNSQLLVWDSVPKIR